MSWLRTAVNRAVEVGVKTGISRTVRNYADSVVVHAGNAVAVGAKIIQERIGASNVKSFRLTVKRLEEVSVSCRGEERVQLLRRWLVALKEFERLSPENSRDIDKQQPDKLMFSDEPEDSPRKPTMVYYVDPDLGTLNYKDVFLYSQALEGISLSMILEVPNEEEVSLLLEIFGLCLAGGKEIHKEVMSSLQDLATAFSRYQDEVLVKREELLQYAQGAIAGLKINADVARIDAEACKILEDLDWMKASHQLSNGASEKPSEEATGTTTEGLLEMLGLIGPDFMQAPNETLRKIQLCLTLEALLLKKKSLSNGDSPQVHAEKVDKLKVLSESLLNSTSKAERRILDQRSQKEEALHFRVAKANEVGQLEKELALEIEQLEKQKDELEAQLKKVNSSLTAARARLHNAREEREQFDEASNQIVIHLKAKDDELSRSINSCRAEADVVNTCIKFIEHAWVLQTNCSEHKEKQTNGDLERYGDYFANLVVHLLAAYEAELGPPVNRIKELSNDLRSCKRSDVAPVLMSDEGWKAINQRKNLEEEYISQEAKILTTLSIMDSIKNQFYTKDEGLYRKDEEKIKGLVDALEKMKGEFESIERPVLEIETLTVKTQVLSRDGSQESPSPNWTHVSETPKNKEEQKQKLPWINGRKARDLHQGIEKIESELENVDGECLLEEIGEWEFDALEHELNASS